MARVWPTTIPRASEPVSTDSYNQMMQEHIEGFNGNINEGQLEFQQIGAIKLAANACNQFATTHCKTNTVEKYPADLLSGWNSVDDMSLSLECKDGTLSGCFSGDIRKYGVALEATATDADPEIDPWRVGIFLDGALIYDSDHLGEEQTALCFPFCESIGAGAHTVEVKVQGHLFTQTHKGPFNPAGTETAAFQFNSRVLWLRNRYR